MGNANQNANINGSIGTFKSIGIITTNPSITIPQSVLPGPFYFMNTGADQTFIVPSGINQITALVWGAGGNSRATGAFVKGTFNVNQGQQITLIVGSGGTRNSGSYGGGGAVGGGGRSGIQINNVEILTAGGGGGWGSNDSGGGSSRYSGTAQDGIHLYGGKGGSQSSGGLAGQVLVPDPDKTLIDRMRGLGQSHYPTVDNTIGSNGSFQLGGNGCSYGGGGGGGGYYGGGGGGGSFFNLADGGGGSSYISPSIINPSGIDSSNALAPNWQSIYWRQNIGMGGFIDTWKGANGMIVLVPTS
jgi:hypothetical protein